MKKLLPLAGLLMLLGGCVNPDEALVNSADMFANTTVGPEYLAYVAADDALTADQKAIRVQNVESFRRAVSAAKGTN